MPTKTDALSQFNVSHAEPGSDKPFEFDRKKMDLEGFRRDLSKERGTDISKEEAAREAFSQLGEDESFDEFADRVGVRSEIEQDTARRGQRPETDALSKFEVSHAGPESDQPFKFERRKPEQRGQQPTRQQQDGTLDLDSFAKDLSNRRGYPVSNTYAAKVAYQQTADPEKESFPEWTKRLGADKQMEHDPRLAARYTTQELKDPATRPGVSPERGIAGDVASHLARGVGRAGELAGYAMQTLDPEGGIEVAQDAGEAMVKGVEQARKEMGIMKPDVSEAQHAQGFFKRGVMEGVESGVPSLTPALTGMAAGSPFGPAGMAIGAGLATLGLFGAGVYGKEKEEAYQKFKQQGLPEEQAEQKAHSFGLEQAMYEGGLETISSIAGVFTFGLGKAATQPVKQTAKELVTSSPKTLTKNIVKNAAINEVPTEMLQEGLQAHTRKRYGLESRSWEEAATSAIIPAVTMSVLFGVGAEGINSVQRKKLRSKLNSEDKQARLEGALEVSKMLRSEDQELARSWEEMANERIKNNEPINLEENFVDFAQQKRRAEQTENYEPPQDIQEETDPETLVTQGYPNQSTEDVLTEEADIETLPAERREEEAEGEAATQPEVRPGQQINQSQTQAARELEQQPSVRQTYGPEGATEPTTTAPTEMRERDFKAGPYETWNLEDLRQRAADLGISETAPGKQALAQSIRQQERELDRAYDAQRPEQEGQQQAQAKGQKKGTRDKPVVGQYVRSGSKVGRVTEVSEDGAQATLEDGSKVPVAQARNWEVSDQPLEGETTAEAQPEAETTPAETEAKAQEPEPARPTGRIESEEVGLPGSLPEYQAQEQVYKDRRAAQKEASRLTKQGRPHRPEEVEGGYVLRPQGQERTRQKEQKPQKEETPEKKPSVSRQMQTRRVRGEAEGETAPVETEAQKVNIPGFENEDLIVHPVPDEETEGFVVSDGETGLRLSTPEKSKSAAAQQAQRNLAEREEGYLANARQEARNNAQAVDQDTGTPYRLQVGTAGAKRLEKIEEAEAAPEPEQAPTTEAEKVEEPTVSKKQETIDVVDGLDGEEYITQVKARRAKIPGYENEPFYVRKSGQFYELIDGETGIGVMAETDQDKMFRDYLKSLEETPLDQDRAEAYEEGYSLAAVREKGEPGRTKGEQTATEEAEQAEETGAEEVSPEGEDLTEYRETWDNRLSSSNRGQLVQVAGWKTKKGNLSKTGKKIRDSSWDSLSPAAQSVLRGKIDAIYGGPIEPEQQPTPIQEGKTKTEAKGNMALYIQEMLENGRSMTWNDVVEAANKAFGGTQADNVWTPRDAYDAIELGFNSLIIDHSQMYDVTRDGTVPAQMSAFDAENKLDSLPTQTRRTQEMDEYQQFSTPPHVSFVASWVANLNAEDTVLEPSAGLGGLAAFPKSVGAKVVANEKDAHRAQILRDQGYDEVYNENAEQLHNILPGNVSATAILMNPPFSATGGRAAGERDVANAQKHLEQALKRLKPNGRLVAVVGSNLSPDRAKAKSFWNRIQKQYNVRANIGFDGQIYRKYGTTADMRLVVIDNNGPTSQQGPIIRENQGTDSAIEALKGVRDERPSVVTGEVGTGTGTAPEQTQPSDAQEGGGTRPPQGGGRPGTAGVGTQGEEGGGPAGGQGKPAPGGGPAPAGTTGRGQEAAGDNRRGRTGQAGETGAGEQRPGGGRGAATSEPTRDHELRRDRLQSQRTGVSSDRDQGAGDGRPQEELSDATYETYRPNVTLANAQPHPGYLAESAAMSAVVPPNPDYTPSLPSSVLEEGRISDAQLEAIIYAGNAHQQMLPDESRKGFFIGDGTGVGKGREVAGILWDNWNQGRKKHVWISKNQDLLSATKRDVEEIGWDSSLVMKHNDLAKAGQQPSDKEGVLFTTYDTVKGESPREGEYSRIDQLEEWLGKDFDGVIVFDEAHQMGNAVPMKGKRGQTKPSATAIAGLELQRRLPNARIVYSTATGATRVSNLSYAARLGLWGPQTPFGTVYEFINSVEKGGVAAMELVASDMKAMGLYMARTLSYENVTYDRIVHELTDEQRQHYNKFAEAWQVVLNNVEQALEATGSKKRGQAMSAFWGAQQRFFNQMLTSMQVPSLLQNVQQELDNGNSALIQLVNTDEATMNRELEANKEGGLEDLDLSPLNILTGFIEKSFPTQQWEEYTDENGNTQSRPVEDSEGNPVHNQDAVERRERLLDEIGSISSVDSPLNMLLDQFGKENVAEITGRSKRPVWGVDNQGNTARVLESRTEAAKRADADAFMDGDKRILVFSEAGGTGASYHADRTRGNQQKRMHFLLQPGWRADVAVQGLGRSHRSNQAHPPTFQLMSTNVPAQRRFLSTIARRLDQLGALTKGQRETGSQGFFQAKDDMESQFARNALYQLFENVNHGHVPGIGLETLEKQTGLDLQNDDGSVVSQLPANRQVLNRFLSLELETMDKVFETFDALLEENVRVAAEQGTLDQGMETLRGESITAAEEEVVYSDPNTGAESKYFRLEVTKPTEFLYFDDAQGQARRDGGISRFVRNKKSGKVWAVVSGTRSRTLADGTVETYRTVRNETWGTARHSENDLGDANKWENLSEEEARSAWNQQVENTPRTYTQEQHIVSGAILPIWDRLPSEDTKILRAMLDDGRVLLGRKLPAKHLNQVLKNLGAGERQPYFTPSQAVTAVMDRNSRLQLANGWKIKRSLVSGEPRIELIGPSFTNSQEMNQLGVFSERIQNKTRYFIPVDQAAEIIEQLTKNRPITDEIQTSGPVYRRTEEGETREASDEHITYLTEHLGGLLKKMGIETGERTPQMTVQASEYGLPQHLQDNLRRQQAWGDVEAIWDPANQRIHVLANQLPTTARAETALIHELLGHAGPEAVLGERTENFYMRIYMDNVKEAQRIAKRRPEVDLNTRQGKFTAAKEMIAERAERGVQDRTIDRLIQAIRNALRKIGFRMRIDNADMRQLIARSMRYMQGYDVAPVTRRTPVETAVFTSRAPTFFSQMEDTLEQKLPNSGSPQALKGQIQNLAKKGNLKQEELAWSGVESWLDQQEGKITKNQVLDYLQKNNIQVNETTREMVRAPSTSTLQALDPESARILEEYGLEPVPASSTQLQFRDEASGEHYTGMAILEGRGPRGPYPSELNYAVGGMKLTFENELSGRGQPRYSEWTLAGGKDYRETLLQLPPGVTEGYSSSHWQEQDVVAHVRFNNRSDTTGNNVLFIEEVQSDWVQEGRDYGFKGQRELPRKAEVQRVQPDSDFFAVFIEDKQAGSGEMTKERAIQSFLDNPKIGMSTPQAPFKQTWPLLAMKRMIRQAAEEGRDKIAWTTGDIQAERSGGGPRIDTLAYSRDDQTGFIQLKGFKDNELVFDRGTHVDDLSNYFGQEVAQQIQQSERKRDILDNVDILIEGQAMEKFYDEILPNMINKYVTRWGVKAQKGTILASQKTDQPLGQMVAEWKIEQGETVYGFSNKQQEWVKLDHPEHTRSEDIVGPFFQEAPLEEVTVWEIPITKEMADSALDIGQPTFRRKDKTRIDTTDILSEEVRTQVEESKGARPTTWLDKAKNALQHAKSQYKATHEFYIDPKQDAALKDMLRQFKDIPVYSQVVAHERIKEILKPLQGYENGKEVFEMNLILSDMLGDMKNNVQTGKPVLDPESDLPFGFKSYGEVEAAYERYRQLAEQYEGVGEALRRREEIMGELRQQLIDAGILRKSVLKDEHYFHHQVLQYLNAMNGQPGTAATGTAEDLRTKWRGWMAARKGSTKNYNTEYAEAEFEVLSEGIEQLEIYKTGQKVKRKYDLKPQLRNQAKRENLDNLWNKLWNEGRLEWDSENQQYKNPLSKHNQKIAMGLNNLKKQAQNGELEYSEEYENTVQALIHGAEPEDLGIDVHESPPHMLNFLNHIAGQETAAGKWARTVFKGISERNNFIKNELSKDFLTWNEIMKRDYPDHVPWRPEKNTKMAKAFSVADRIVDEVFRQGEATIQAQNLDSVQMVVPGESWVIPDRVGQQLNDVMGSPAEGAIGRASASLLTKWKQWILLNPLRLTKYNLNNMSGDLDIATAYAPEIWTQKRFLVQSFKDLIKFHRGGEFRDTQTKEELEMWLRKGAIESGMTVYEIDDLTEQIHNDRFLKDIVGVRNENIMKRAISKYWNGAKNFTRWRENLLRLAAARFFLEKWRQQPGLYYGVSNKAEVDALDTLEDKAAKLGRELIGDYGNISTAGQYIRRRLIPFYSWMEINAPRYAKLIRNLKHEGRTGGAPGVMAWKTAKLGVKASALYTAINLFNHVFHPEEEDDLKEYERRQLHLILGKREDGEIITLRFQGALSDALSWFGAEDLPYDVQDLVEDEATVQEKVTEAAKAVPTKFIFGYRPGPKLLFEGLTGRKLYPRPFEQGVPIRDMPQHVLNTFSLGGVWNKLSGKPDRYADESWANAFLSDVAKLATYSTAPGESAYYSAKKMVYDYQDRQGRERPTISPTNRSNALYYYKQALKFGDMEAAAKYRKKYQELGGTYAGISKSLKRAHPLAGLPKAERYTFRQSLDKSEEDTLNRAIKWWRDTYGSNLY